MDYAKACDALRVGVPQDQKVVRFCIAESDGRFLIRLNVAFVEPLDQP